MQNTNTMIQEDLKKSGLDLDYVGNYGIKVFNGSSEELKKRLGYTHPALQNAKEILEIPYYDKANSIIFSRFRIYPASDDKKYLHPLRTPGKPYIPHEVWEVADKSHIPLWITEGEKKAIKLIKEGRMAVALSGVWNFKAGKDSEDAASKELWEELLEFQLSRRVVFIAFDMDLWENPQVRMALYELALKLYKKNATVRFAEWDVRKGKGIDDLLGAVPNPREVLSTIESKAKRLEDFADKDHYEAIKRAFKMVELPDDKREMLAKPLSKTFGLSMSCFRQAIQVEKACEGQNALDNNSQTTQLLSLITTSSDLGFFVDEAKELWASVKKNGHTEYYAVESSSFKSVCRKVFIDAYRNTINNDSLQTALDNLSALLGDGLPSKKTHLRIGWHDNCIYYDLANPEWQVVRIDKTGWEIINESPIIFKRFPHMQQQVVPVQTPSLFTNHVLDFANTEDVNLKILILVWVVCLFIPEISHPILVLHGDQGSGKTFFYKLIKSLGDPSVMKTLSLNDNIEEVVRCLSHHYFNPFDNLSIMPQKVSDLFCRAVTGEGYAKRKLYTDDEDIVYNYKRVIALNGINNVVERPDLLDRSILGEWQRVQSDKMKPEDILVSEFEKIKPEILGGIFSVLSEILSRYPSSPPQRQNTPRMADFDCYARAVAEILGIGEEKFAKAYDENIDSHDKEAIGGSSVATVLMAFMEGKQQWEGSATELLSSLGDETKYMEIDKRFSDWPKNPNSLSKELNRLRINLEKSGIRISRGWKRDSKILRIFNDKFENDAAEEIPQEEAGIFLK